MLQALVRDAERKVPREVLPVTGDRDQVVAAWGDAIHRQLADPEAAFARAADVRHQLEAHLSWPRVVAQLRDALDLGRNAVGVVAVPTAVASNQEE
jgi:hypothetical protein